MDDLEPRLRAHYAGQNLPADRAQAILAAGRTAARRRKSSARWWMAAAALLVGFSTIAILAYRERPQPPVATASLTTDAIAGAVTQFFSDPEYQLSQVSADPRRLAAWLREQGGPEHFVIPPAMRSLSSYGCQVLDVQGQRVHLICFLLDAAPPAAGAMPGKAPMMVVTNPDGTMMKKSLPLVHLVTVPRAAFANAPQLGERVNLPAQGDWNYVAWTEGDQVYLAASTVPSARLRLLAAAL